jgi:uncharacterized phage protein gp47/JayE
MSLIPAKSKLELIADVIDYLRSRYPSIDLIPGTVARDLLVEAPMEYIAHNITQVNFIGEMLNLDTLYTVAVSNEKRVEYANNYDLTVSDVQNIITAIIDLYAANYSIGRSMGTKSSGYLTFFSRTKPTATSSIPAGTVCRIANTNLTFRTLAAVTMPANPTGTDANKYYDSLNNFWRVSVSAESLLVGSAANVPAQAITQCDLTTISLEVINTERFSGGSDAEDDASLLSRIKTALTGNFRGTADSILNSIRNFPNVKDAVIAYKYGDTNKVRQNITNAIDVFIYANTVYSYTESIPGLVSGSLVNTSDAFLLAKPFVSNVASVAFGTFTSPSRSYSLSLASNINEAVYGESYISFLPIPANVISDSTGSGLAYTVNIPATGITDVYGAFPEFVAGNPVVSNIVIYSKPKTSTAWSTIIPLDLATYRTIGGRQALVLPTTIFDTTNYDYGVKLLPAPTDTITISYFYSGQDLTDVSNYLNGSANHFVGQDIRVYPAIPVAIKMEVIVQISQDPAYGIADRAAAVKEHVLSVIAKYNLGVEVNQSELVSEILTVAGVIDVQIPFTTLKPKYLYNTAGVKVENTSNEVTDILLAATQYPYFEYATDLKVTAQTGIIGLGIR